MKLPTRRTGTQAWLAPLVAVLVAMALPALSLRAQTEPSAFHLSRYDLEVELLPDVHQLHARARMTVTADETLASLIFQLNPNLKVEKVLDVNDKPLTFQQTAQTGELDVDLAEKVLAGKTAVVVVDYTGTFDPEIKPESGPRLASIAPASTYLLPAAQWFPQSSNPWARFAMRLAVTLPADEIPLAPGHADAPTTPAPGKTRVVFHADEAIPGGTLVAGKYEKVSPAAGAPITFYLHTAPRSAAEGNAQTVGDIIAFFSDRFAPLAHPQLAIAETSDDTWEFQSAPGLLLLPLRQWSSSINPRLLARAIARQWWAARVSPANEDATWLADGLARYSEALYLEHSAGEEAFRQALQDFTVGALVDEGAAPIANADRLDRYTPQFNSVISDKGAMVFHMLRQVIGDDAFFRLLHAYADQFAGRGATIDDFEKLAEQVSGKTLDYFFSEWVRSTGVPQFNMEYIIYRTQKGFRVAGTIKHEMEIFRMPVPIHIETEGPPVTQNVEVTGPSTDFSIDTFGKPTKVEIDPDLSVLHYTPDLRIKVAIARGEDLFQRGKYYEATQAYMDAVKVKRNSSLAHYRLGEAFFAQRNYQAAANSFREAVNGDQEPKWTVVWSHIFLGKIFDITGQRERAINEYRHALDTKDNTQGAQAEAEKYLREPYRRESRTIEQQP